MGVRGIQTVLKEQKLNLRREAQQYDHRVQGFVYLIVDASGFLFSTARTDSLRGGNYSELTAMFKQYVTYWRKCGFVPVFVFDGKHRSVNSSMSLNPLEVAGQSSESKQPEVLKRARSSLTNAINYMNDKSSSRRQSKQRINNVERVPLLASATLIDALRDLKVEVHHATGEADHLVANLANEYSGYILAYDTDYLFFKPDEKRGYIPLQDI
ncbi:hypothetical protein OIO90_006272 [Microbotryomycetes sp. JL221]|nr:hypothetical protein OIO90_006272 [Microbotryomycetes sp. JL221]